MACNDAECLVGSYFSDDVIFLAGKDAILSKFKNFNSGLVFATERYCVPDETLAVSR